MARNGSGTYSVVNTFVSGTSITAADHNENWSDLASEMTNSVAVDGQSTMSGAFKAASGTVAAPGIAFGSDTDSGLYRIGANNIGVAVNGAKVIDVATTGATITGNVTATADVDGVTVKQGGFQLLPSGVVVPYAGTAAPNGWLLCYGQSLVRADYVALFNAIGTTFGAADPTHFSLPDMRGRVPAGQDDMGGTSANNLTGVTGSLDGDTLGAAGGSETNTLTLAQLPTGITAANASQAISVVSSVNVIQNASIVSSDDVGGSRGQFSGTSVPANDPLASTGSNSISVTSNNTSGSAHPNVQPTIILNYIIKY
jgi:microcystin-dependent protein